MQRPFLNSGYTALNKVADAYLSTPAISWLLFPVDNKKNFEKMGDMIADHCKEIHQKSVMLTISCVAKSVNATLKQTGWPDRFTSCRAHAAAFRAAFSALNIPRSSVFNVDGSTSTGQHTVSRFILTSKSGQTYSYVIDTGIRPGIIFPNSEITENWYEKSDAPPVFSYEEPQYEFLPIKNFGTK